VHGQNKNDMGGGAGGDDVEYYKSGGCKISNRHRRRRTGSHKRRRFHRFPQGDGDGDAEDEYDGHDGDGDGDEGERAMSGSLSRRGRRKHTILRATNTQWQWNMNTNTPNTTTQSMASNAIDSNKKWMMTHLYHSKRFHMMTPTPTPHTSSTSSNTTSNSSISIFNGWCVPLCHTNRGSQAALRLATNDGKCTIQDSTWNIGGSILTLTANTASSTSKGSRSKVVNLVSRLLSYNAAAVLTPRVLDGMEVGYGLVYDDHITDSDITFPDGALGPASFLFGTSSSCSTRTTRENDDGDNNEENTHTCYYVKILMEGSILKKATKMIHELWHEMDTTDGETDADGEDLDSEEESKSDENANENAHANKSSSSSSSSSSNSSSIHTNAMTLLRLRGADATEIISRNLLFHRYRSHNVGHGHGHGHGHDYDYDYEERLHDHLPHGTVIKLTFDSVVNVNDDDVQKDDYLKQFRRDLASSKGSGNGNGNGSSNGSTGSTGKKVEDCESSNGNGGSVSLKAILNVNVNGDGDAHGHGHGNATDTSTAGKDNEIILISQNPNRSTSTSTSTSHSNANANANANTTVNGWDILLPPSLAHTIFIALVHDNAHNHKHGGVSGAGAGGGEGGGGACPIGLVEEACMRTEADPPLPVYPRDYMDTALGLEYWNGDGDGDGDDEREAEVRKRRKEWKVVRYCMEEGTTNGGRIKTGLKRLLQECHVTDRHMDMDRNGNGNEKYEKLNDKDKDKDKAKDTGMISKGMKSEYGNASNGDGGTALPNSNSSCTGNDRNSNTNIHEKEEVDIDTDTSSSSSKEVRDRDRDRDATRNMTVTACRDRDNHASPKLKMPYIDWHALLVHVNLSNANDDDDDISHQKESIVVVRGAFASPFIQALDGFGESYRDAIACSTANNKNVDADANIKGSKQRKKRRPRRKSRRGNSHHKSNPSACRSCIIVLPPIPLTLLSQQRQYCANLISSLSIPALIRCHLIVEGKGAIFSGMSIYTEMNVEQEEEKGNDDNNNNDGDNGNKNDERISHNSVLGYAVSGRFSQERGTYHGVGFISSQRFLSYLKDFDKHGHLFYCRNGKEVHNDTAGNDGSDGSDDGGGNHVLDPKGRVALKVYLQSTRPGSMPVTCTLTILP